MQLVEEQFKLHADVRIEAIERQFDRMFADLKNTRSLLEHRYQIALENGRIVAASMVQHTRVFAKIAEKFIAQEFSVNVQDHVVVDIREVSAQLADFMSATAGIKRTQHPTTTTNDSLMRVSKIAKFK